MFENVWCNLFVMICLFAVFGYLVWQHIQINTLRRFYIDEVRRLELEIARRKK